MLGIPRHAPDLVFALRGLRAFYEGAHETLVMPTRRAVSNLRPDELGLNAAEGEALASSIAAAHYLPAALPLEVLPTVQREFLLPVVAGRKPADRAARDARLPIELAIRQAQA